ncbi:MAG: hypothetical protein RIC89_19135 [Pseudomonadales bacterium]
MSEVSAGVARKLRALGRSVSDAHGVVLKRSDEYRELYEERARLQQARRRFDEGTRTLKRHDGTAHGDPDRQLADIDARLAEIELLLKEAEKARTDAEAIWHRLSWPFNTINEYLAGPQTKGVREAPPRTFMEQMASRIRPFGGE